MNVLPDEIAKLRKVISSPEAAQEVTDEQTVSEPGQAAAPEVTATQTQAASEPGQDETQKPADTQLDETQELADTQSS